MSKIYKTLAEAEARIGKCPRPITQNKSHWWYINWDHEIYNHDEESADPPDFVPHICKTCSAKVNVDVNAEDHAEV